jgi:hypothetical protein
MAQVTETLGRGISRETYTVINLSRELPVPAVDQTSEGITIATQADISARIAEQDRRHADLSRTNNLTPEWRVYGRRRGLSGNNLQQKSSIR